MRIKIAENFRERYINSFPGKTTAAKKIAAEHTFFRNSPARPWIDTMSRLKGEWVEVEAEYLFEDQFNTETSRVDCTYIDAVDFSPEFKNVDEFLAAVQKRYDKDWPGRNVGKKLRNLISLGFIKIKTV